MINSDEHKSILKKIKDYDSKKIIKRLHENDSFFLTYINPIKLKKSYFDYYRDAEVRVDGYFISKIYSIIGGQKIQRASFDFSGLAPDVFCFAKKNKKRIAVIGGSETEVQKFQDVIKEKYNLDIKIMSGYFEKNKFDAVLQEFSKFDADIYIVGLGGVLQDKFGHQLFKSTSRTVFCCGAFITQTAKKGGYYYPEWIIKFELRWLYRIINERGHFTKIFKEYIMFLRKVTSDLL